MVPLVPLTKPKPKKSLKRKNKSGLKYSTPAKKQRRDWGQPPQNVPTLNSETSSSNGINDAPTPAPTENSKPQSAPQKHTLLNESGESAKENTDEHNCNSPCDPVIPSCKSPVIIVNDDSPDPPLWVKLENCNPDDPESKLILYHASKSSILNKTSWLTDSEIHAGQLLLKKEFPFLDGLNDTTITGSHVVPARSDFVQIVNTGSHWVCLSTIATRPASGTVRIFDSLYLKPSSIAIKHACRMLMFPGDQITLINEKVQRQVGINDCGLFALAFAADLCHGLDPVNQSMNKNLCGNIMSAAWRMEQWCHFRKQQGEFLFISAATNHLLLSTVYVECHMIKRNMFSAATDAEHGIILLVSTYQSGLLTAVESGSVANAEKLQNIKGTE